MRVLHVSMETINTPVCQTFSRKSFNQLISYAVRVACLADSLAASDNCQVDVSYAAHLIFFLKQMHVLDEAMIEIEKETGPYED